MNEITSQVDWANILVAVTGIIAAVSAWYASKSKTKNDFVLDFQKAVQKDLQSWKDEAKSFKAEAQKWRDEVYMWKDKASKIEDENRDLKSENVQLKRDVDRLQGDVDKLKQKLKDNNINGF